MYSVQKVDSVGYIVHCHLGLTFLMIWNTYMAVQFTLRGSTLLFACHTDNFLFLAPMGVVFLFPSLPLLAFFSFTDVREQKHLHSNLSLWILHCPMTLHESFSCSSMHKQAYTICFENLPLFSNLHRI